MKRILSLTLYVCVAAALFSGALVIFAAPVSAQSIYYGDRVPAGVTVENDLILVGNDVVIDGTVNGDVLALGSRVTINGTVDGSLVTAGETVTLNGKVNGSTYAAAIAFLLNAGARLERSLNFAGGRIVTQNGAQIGRDLNALALDAQLAGTVGRDVRALIGVVALVQQFMKLVNPQTTTSFLVPAHSTTGIESLPVAALAPAQFPIVVNALPPAQQQAPSDFVNTWLLPRLREFITILIVGALGLWLLPQRVKAWAQTIQARPLPALGYGFVFYIVAIAGAFLIGALLVMAGLGLFALTLSSLGWMVWGIGFALLSLAFSLFILLATYASYALVSYLTGKLILQRVYPRGAENRFLPLLLGAVLVTLLLAIPFLGAVVGFLVAFWGLGALWLVLRAKPAQMVPAAA